MHIYAFKVKVLHFAQNDCFKSVVLRIIFFRHGDEGWVHNLLVYFAVGVRSYGVSCNRTEQTKYNSRGNL